MLNETESAMIGEPSEQESQLFLTQPETELEITSQSLPSQQVYTLSEVPPQETPTEVPSLPTREQIEENEASFRQQYQKKLRVNVIGVKDPSPLQVQAYKAYEQLRMSLPGILHEAHSKLAYCCFASQATPENPARIVLGLNVLKMDGLFLRISGHYNAEGDSDVSDLFVTEVILVKKGVDESGQTCEVAAPVTEVS